VSVAPDPTLPADPPPPPAYPVVTGCLSAAWAGQDGATSAVPGEVHVTVSGLPAGWALAAAELTDDVGSEWIAGNRSAASALTLTPAADPTKADLTFAPTRDETGTLMTLSIRLAGGQVQYVTQFPGGSADPALRDPLPAGTSITVDPSYVSQPGHDLNTLVQTYGTVHLQAGVYPLSRPLDLVNPVSVVADPGTTLLFSQPAGDPGWSSAVTIHRSHTSLDGTVPGGLAIRFATPVRWAPPVGGSAGVIASSPDDPAPKVDVNLENLDILYNPTAADLGGYSTDTVRLIQMSDGDSGQISGDVLRGGFVEVVGGPWKITDNDYQGATTGSTVVDAFVVRDGHDVVIQGNHAHSVGASGITYGFAYFSDAGWETSFLDNVVDGGIGRDAAVSPGGQYNFPSIILTESYAPHYEGVAVTDPDNSRMLRVPALRGNPGAAGDIVTILSGPDAGSWFRIAQVIDAHNYLLDGDLPVGNYAVSISQGFVDETYAGNRIDATSLQQSSSIAFDLVGAHANTSIRGNTVIGCTPFDITSAPTEGSAGSATPYPAPWGWTHLPVFGLVVDGNTFRDPTFWTAPADGTAAVEGVGVATLDVEHAPLIRATTGRVYLTASLTNNLFDLTDTFLNGTSGNLTVLQIGDASALDPSELRVSSLQGNTYQAPAAFALAGRSVLVDVESGKVAGQVGARSIPLPAANPVVSGLAATVLGQDGSDEVGLSTTTEPDGLQDVHLVLEGLRPDLAVVMVDVNPYGYGHYQYADPTLPPDTPGLTPADWRAGFQRASTGPGAYATTADVYVQPVLPEDGRNHWDVKVTYADGSVSYISAWGIVADPSLADGATAPGIRAVSLGQDDTDFVGRSTTAAPDGFQDVHIALSGLPTDSAIAQVDVLPYSYGHWQYVAPDAPPLPPDHPNTPDRDPGDWRAALVRATTSAGAYATTADLYVPSIIKEDGSQPSTTPVISNHYDIGITFFDGTTVWTTVWGVVDDPTLRVVPTSPAATSAPLTPAAAEGAITSAAVVAPVTTPPADASVTPQPAQAPPPVPAGPRALGRTPSALAAALARPSVVLRDPGTSRVAPRFALPGRQPCGLALCGPLTLPHF
jgi:hypothetical protein